MLPLTAAILSVTGPNKRLHAPFIEPLDKLAVVNCDPIGYEAINELERLVATYTGCQFAIAVSSGTAALHLALLGVGVRRWSGVLIPTMEFAGAAAAVKYCGAQLTLYDKLDRYTSRTMSAVIAVDLLGHPCELPDIDLPVIVDAAQSLGSMIGGKHAAARGGVAVVSFNNNKIVTTGGGGMVLTDDAAIADRVRHLATTAKVASPFYFNHDAVGYNYRMSNMAAALALGQMARIEAVVERKRALRERYGKALAGLAPIYPTDELRDNAWLTAISVPDPEPVMRELAEHGVAARALYTPLHLQKPYRDQYRMGDLSGAEKLWRTTICLPSGSDMC